MQFAAPKRVPRVGVEGVEHAEGHAEDGVVRFFGTRFGDRGTGDGGGEERQWRPFDCRDGSAALRGEHHEPAQLRTGQREYRTGFFVIGEQGRLQGPLELGDPFVGRAGAEVAEGGQYRQAGPFFGDFAGGGVELLAGFAGLQSAAAAIAIQLRQQFPALPDRFFREVELAEFRPVFAVLFDVVPGIVVVDIGELVPGLHDVRPETGVGLGERRFAVFGQKLAEGLVRAGRVFPRGHGADGVLRGAQLGEELVLLSVFPVGVFLLKFLVALGRFAEFPFRVKLLGFLDLLRLGLLPAEDEHHHDADERSE